MYKTLPSKEQRKNYEYKYDGFGVNINHSML